MAQSRTNCLSRETQRDCPAYRFLRSYSEYFFGVPGEDWLRSLLNRIDAELFEACFTRWALSLRPDAADLIALDGKSFAADMAPRTWPSSAASPSTSSIRGAESVPSKPPEKPLAGAPTSSQHSSCLQRVNLDRRRVPRCAAIAEASRRC